MSSDFFIQTTNLLSQQLASLAGEEIYAQTSCMDPEYRNLIAILLSLKKMKPSTSKAINKIFPLLENLGKAAWFRTELTDLGLRVGQRNIEEVKDTRTIDDVENP